MSEVAYRSLFCMLSTSRDEAAVRSFKLVPLVRTPGHSVADRAGSAMLRTRPPASSVPPRELAWPITGMRGRRDGRFQVPPARRLGAGPGSYELTE